MSDPRFFEIPDEERGFLGLGERRTKFERMVYGLYLLKRELFMLRGRANRLGERWLAENAPEFVDYSSHVDDKAINTRMIYLMQEISYLRAALKLQAAIELKKRHRSPAQGEITL